MSQPYRRTLSFFYTLTAAAVALSAFASDGARAEVPPSHYAMTKAVIDRVVLPHFSKLAETASQLPDDVAQVCKVGDDASHEMLISTFRNVVQAWGGVDYFRFGPLTEAARRERMAFWPDPRGVMVRQLRGLIAAHDDKALADGGIAKQSAAVQGLPALEVLIFNDKQPLGPADGARYRCRLAHAVAVNVATIAGELNRDWTKDGGWRDKMLRPGSDNDMYRHPQESAGEFVKAFLTGLTLIGDGEVKPRLDPNAKFRPPYAKSEATRLYFIAGVKSLKELYDAMDLEAYLPDNKDWVKNWAGGAWRTLLATDGAGGRVSSVPKDEAPLLRKVHGMFTGLRKVTVAELSKAAGLTVGFNELDGD